jgi:hypothetical protein
MLITCYAKHSPLARTHTSYSVEVLCSMAYNYIMLPSGKQDSLLIVFQLFASRDTQSTTHASAVTCPLLICCKVVSLNCNSDNLLVSTECSIQNSAIITTHKPLHAGATETMTGWNYCRPIPFLQLMHCLKSVRP